MIQILLQTSTEMKKNFEAKTAFLYQRVLESSAFEYGCWSGCISRNGKDRSALMSNFCLMGHR